MKKVIVTYSNGYGDYDKSTYEHVRLNIEDGSLIITAPFDETIEAIYAPGVWRTASGV